MTYKLTVTTLALTAITSTVAATHAKPDTEHPHIVLILCDDMGFSDLSCYGGEIHTPNIDYLAEQGIRFSQFKNTGRSCPSRAALLTGHYQHGLGDITSSCPCPSFFVDFPAAVAGYCLSGRSVLSATVLSGSWSPRWSCPRCSRPPACGSRCLGRPAARCRDWCRNGTGDPFPG